VKLVILDRDGVINQDSDEFIKNPAEWIALGGSLEAIARLNYFGFKVAVASNQSGIARGLMTLDDLNAIHQKMRQQLDRVGGLIEGVFFCPHGADDGCDCRKPAPGLLYQIKGRLGVELEGVAVVGDSLRDLQSAATVGAKPILVETGKGLKTRTQLSGELAKTPCFPDLSAATEYILAMELGRRQS
jgi:D-glycero-D-manno-heptose 1,7-bisphosphate phosphatase